MSKSNVLSLSVSVCVCVFVFLCLSVSLSFPHESIIKSSRIKPTEPGWLHHPTCDTQFCLLLWTSISLLILGEKSLPGLDCLSRANGELTGRVGVRAVGQCLATALQGPGLRPRQFLVEIANYWDGNGPIMVNVMVANMLLKSRLRSHITTQYLKQQMHHTRQLLEHRPQENVVDHQDVKSFGNFVVFLKKIYLLLYLSTL